MNEQTKTRRLIRLLVDNEASHQQQRELLMAAEAAPELYRDIALAYVEQRQLNDLLGEQFPQTTNHRRLPHSKERLRRPENSYRPRIQAPPLNGRTRSLNGESRDRLSPNGQRRTRWKDLSKQVGDAPSYPAPVETHHRTRARRRVIALAACLILFGLLSGVSGWNLRQFQQAMPLVDHSNLDGAPQPDRTFTGPQGNNSPRTLEGASPESPDAASHAWARQPHVASNADQAMRVALVQSIVNVSNFVPPRAQLELLRNGLLISETERDVDVPISDGRIVRVPVKSVEVNYLGDRIYQ